MLWLTLVLYHLIVCEFLFRTVKAGGRVRRTIIGRYPVCPRGCTSCSPINGCVTCETRLFLFIHRQDMREVGICTPSCPVGYFGARHQYYNKCTKCNLQHCYSCFSRQFCTLCESPYLVNEGQCIERCPEGSFYANFTRQCTDRVDCLAGAWSAWSECTRNGQNCGFRRGLQNRTRPILQDASPNGTPCPEVTQSQRCRLSHPECDGVCPGRWRKRRKNKERRRKKKWRTRGDRRDRGRKGRRKVGRRRQIRKHTNQKRNMRRQCRGCKRMANCRKKRVRPPF
ncbi:unnamed protein product [Lymnaea stagnalis]|uniref:R-spondin Fu-CRD domain-containing protein n=1 Tax=Lymnaea stagnalis TaxID=6523 RepID=A0AAV2IJB2_LYMST